MKTMQDPAPTGISQRRNPDVCLAKEATCNRCIMDTTVPGISFDAGGQCNFCTLHDNQEKQFPLNEEGKRRLDALIEDIRRAGRSKPYDCVLGVSGGRDSSYTLWRLKKVWNLRPLAVHFNDGFGNPVAGENMVKASNKLGVELRTITSDWRESKDLKLAFLKASVPDMEQGTDLGIATALYGVAAKEGIKHVILGQSFRTEGVAPLSWSYLDGKYLSAVHKQFGTVPLRKWRASDPGFHLNLFHMFYYLIWKGIKTIPLLYYVDYVRRDADELLKRELDWEYTGAHYFDDLYQSMMTYILRKKFNIDRRLFNYSALVRSGQMTRARALENVKQVYVIEAPDIIRLCIKRLGISQADFDATMALPPKTFRDYPNHYAWIRRLKPLIQLCCKLEILPWTAYDKYFRCGR